MTERGRPGWPRSVRPWSSEARCESPGAGLDFGATLAHGPDAGRGADLVLHHNQRRLHAPAADDRFATNSIASAALLRTMPMATFRSSGSPLTWGRTLSRFDLNAAAREPRSRPFSSREPSDVAQAAGVWIARPDVASGTSSRRSMGSEAGHHRAPRSHGPGESLGQHERCGAVGFCPACWPARDDVG